MIVDTDILIQSDRILFRKTAKKDLDFVLNLEHHPENNPFIIPWTRERHINALENQDILHVMIESSECRAVGYLILAGLSNHNHCIEFMRIVIAVKGHGYGKESIKLVQDYVFNRSQAHRLWLDVKEQNHRAKHLYESSGFKVEGTLRECLKNGDHYESLIIMGMLEDDYRN